MTNAILRGKPDAGNPHVRFDEGEVASAKPRRGSLLYKTRVLLMTGLAVGATLTVAAADFNVRDYGGSVAQAAEAAGKAGGGRVVVPAGEWTSGTIWLKSHVELHLEKGAVVKGSTKQTDYNADDVFPENFHSVGEEWSGAHLVLAYKAEDVAITGEGVIDGNGPAFFGETQEEGWGPWYKYGIKLHPTDREWYRPGPMVAMFQTKNIRLEGVTLRNTPCWTAHFRCCDGLVAKGVTIDADREIANSDGFSIDCTRNVEVTGCTVRTGDDGFAIRASCKHHATTNLCENIRIRDCDVSSCCFGIRFGVGTGTIRNVRVENCRFHESGCGIGFTPAWTDSGKNVYIEDITVMSSHIGECERPVEAPSGPGDARVRNVRFANCTLEGLLPSRVQKSAKWQPENFVFENCSYHMIRRLKVRMNREWLARHYKNRPRTFLADSNADVKLVKCTSDEPTESGVLLLTFDDRNFDDWEKALPLFAKYKAHATFFVCGEIDNRAVRTMKRLSEAGHSVGLHGLRHADAATLVDQLGGEAYWRQEVWPQLEKAGVSYLSTWNFAYPNCYRSEQSDALFKSKGVLHVRGGVKGATPYDPTGAKQKDRKPLVTNEAVYFPSKDLPNRHLINSILVGESYHTDIDEICACLRRVAERKEVICITSHGIRPDAKSINMKTAWLEKILSTAQELKLPVLGYDELPRPCGL